MTYTKLNLINAINKVNVRYKAGLNDDDQVSKMLKIADSLKGYYIKPCFDTYEICTDEERLNFLSSQYGYWSDEVKSFNAILTKKGGVDYMRALNSKLIEANKQHERTRIQPQLF
jgi:hypothetical protein